jgi:hypothetical protein
MDFYANGYSETRKTKSVRFSLGWRGKTMESLLVIFCCWQLRIQ